MDWSPTVIVLENKIQQILTACVSGFAFPLQPQHHELQVLGNRKIEERELAVGTQNRASCSTDINAASVGCTSNEAGDGVQERCLAGTVWADNRDNLSSCG